MKKIQSTQKIIITVKDAENDTLTEREEYFYNEYISLTVFENEIFAETGKKIASYSCCHYGYDNYSVITNNPTLICLMIEAGRINVDIQHFENLADIPQDSIDNYHRIAN